VKSLETIFELLELEYDKVNILDNIAGYGVVKNLGYNKLPVVVVSDDENETIDHW
jgi:hypothetical protein